MDADARDLLAASQVGMLQKQLFLVQHELRVPVSELAPHVDTHHEYVAELEADGRLIGAGPFLDDDGEATGSSLWILDVGTETEALELAEADPLCRAGLRVPTARSWRLNVGRMGRT